MLALLVAAACGTSAQPEPRTPDPVRTYRIRRLADSPVARTGHVAIGLADGSALVMGGNSSEAINLPDSSTTQRFDPTSETFTAGPPLALSALDRNFTVPVPLRAGAFLLVGGGIFTAVAEIYDPTTGRFQPTGALRQGRGFHQATRLADGRVLLSGGFGASVAAFEVLATSEIFDPVTEKFSSVGVLQVARFLHSALLLPDGQVLAVGGIRGGAQAGSGISETELFDAHTGNWTAGPRLDPASVGVTATLLGNGKVLLFGGEDAQGFPRPNAFLLE